MVVFTILLMEYSGTADSRILLEGNGYTNILVAISGDIPPPSDGGVDVVDTLQVNTTLTHLLSYCFFFFDRLIVSVF